MFGRLQLLIRRSRRLVAVASLVGFSAAVCGVPVINPRIGKNGKDISQPFPCMHSQCGCQNAEACWRGCCCHTNAEKLAWAKNNGVTPPDYLHVAAAKEGNVIGKVAASCCDQPAVTSCCSTSGQCDAEGLAEDVATSSHEWQWSIVPAVSARKCQGLAQLWLMLSTVPPGAKPYEVKLETLIAGRVEVFDIACVEGSYPPATPPPKA
jgi:hypothetical protein